MPHPKTDEMIQSATNKNSAAKTTMISTIIVETHVSRRVGQVTFAISARTWRKNVIGLVFATNYTFRIITGNNSQTRSAPIIAATDKPDTQIRGAK